MISAKIAPAAKAPKSALPLFVLTAAKFEGWVKKQPAFVQNLLQTRAFTAAAGSFCLITDQDGKPASVVAGIGEPASLWDLSALPLALPEGNYLLENVKNPKEAERLAQGWILGSHQYDQYKKNVKGKASTLYLPAKTDVKRAELMAQTTVMARDLITMTAEDLGPAELADAIVQTAKANGAKVSQIIGDDLLKKNYPAIHAVGRASARAPRLVDLRWGNPKHPTVTLVGKGVCFDTGGLDLKDSTNMYLMRKDMGGAAVALAVARYIMERKMKVCLRLLVPAVENSINDKAYHPSDIVTMRNGLTVEVSNTDAEGRMILADALAEADSEKPDLLISFGTLGPARGIFGEHVATCYSHDDKLATQLNKLSEEEEDYIWRMPLYKEYDAKLKSSFADIESSPRAAGGSLMLAAFLHRFVKQSPRYVALDFFGWHSVAAAGRPEGGNPMTLRAVCAMLEKLYPTS